MDLMATGMSHTRARYGTNAVASDPATKARSIALYPPASRLCPASCTRPLAKPQPGPSGSSAPRRRRTSPLFHQSLRCDVNPPLQDHHIEGCLPEEGRRHEDDADGGNRLLIQTDVFHRHAVVDAVENRCVPGSLTAEPSSAAVGCSARLLKKQACCRTKPSFVVGCTQGQGAARPGGAPSMLDLPQKALRCQTARHRVKARRRPLSTEG